MGACFVCHAFLPTDDRWILGLDIKVELMRIVTFINVKILIMKNVSLIFTYFVLA